MIQAQRFRPNWIFRHDSKSQEIPVDSASVNRRAQINTVNGMSTRDREVKCGMLVYRDRVHKVWPVRDSYQLR